MFTGNGGQVHISSKRAAGALDQVTLLRFAFLGLLALFGALGCSRVTKEDLIGTWQMRPTDRALLPQAIQGATATLTLNSDGTFSALELPLLFCGAVMTDPPISTSGSGTWKTALLDGEEVELRFSGDKPPFPPRDGKVPSVPSVVGLHIRRTWIRPFGTERILYYGECNVELQRVVDSGDDGQVMQ